MTREEAIELLCYGDWLNVISEHIGKQDTERIAKAMCIVGKAIRPVSRERVEKMRGKWIDARYSSKDVPQCQCSICGKKYIGLETDFCQYCGAPMTDKAVDILWKRLEAMQDEAETV